MALWGVALVLGVTVIIILGTLSFMFKKHYENRKMLP